MIGYNYYLTTGMIMYPCVGNDPSRFEKQNVKNVAHDELNKENNNGKKIKG